jgi:hypothetical protein
MRYVRPRRRSYPSGETAAAVVYCKMICGQLARDKLPIGGAIASDHDMEERR